MIDRSSRVGGSCRNQAGHNNHFDIRQGHKAGSRSHRLAPILFGSSDSRQTGFLGSRFDNQTNHDDQQNRYTEASERLQFRWWAGTRSELVPPYYGSSVFP